MAEYALIDHRLRVGWRCLPLPIAWMGILWWLSSQSSKPGDIPVVLILPMVAQKVMHVVAYAILAGSWLWVLSGTRFAMAATCAAALTVGYAAVDEVHQSSVPGRTSSVLDVGLDAIGAAVVIGLAFRTKSSACASSI